MMIFLKQYMLLIVFIFDRKESKLRNLTARECGICIVGWAWEEVVRGLSPIYELVVFCLCLRSEGSGEEMALCTQNGYPIPV